MEHRCPVCKTIIAMVNLCQPRYCAEHDPAADVTEADLTFGAITDWYDGSELSL
jgi:hypothetical protein